MFTYIRSKMYLKEFSETIVEEQGSMWYLGRGEHWQSEVSQAWMVSKGFCDEVLQRIPVLIFSEWLQTK